MADMEIVVTSGVEVTEIADEYAADFKEAYEALAKLPVNRMVNYPTFLTAADPANPTEDEIKAGAKLARAFVRQGKAWAAAQEIVVPIVDGEGNITGSRVTALMFARKGNVKANPCRVSFRIYAPRAGSVTGENAVK
jgi:hypothetical protein